MSRFTPDDDRTYTLIPKGKYPARVEKVYTAEKPDSEGRTFYKAELEIVSRDYAGNKITVNLSEHWMKHLLIHIMRAVRMMDVMVVDTFFRGNPTDSASFSMATVMGNLVECKIGIEIVHQQGKGDNSDKTYHNVKDFYKLRKQDGSDFTDQPAWKEVAPVHDPSDDLEPDIELEDEDDADFLQES